MYFKGMRGYAGKDHKYKCFPVEARFFPCCNHVAIGDTKHVLMQCPRFWGARGELLNEIRFIHDVSGRRLLETHCVINCADPVSWVYWLMI